MDKKATDIIGYISFLGWAIAYFAGTKEESNFHLNQSLVVNIAGLIGGVIPIIGWLFDVFVLVIAIMGIIAAANGEEKELPLVGKFKILK